MFVLDCSITMAWLFADEKTDLTEKVMNRLTNEDAIVPSLWIFEVTNVLLGGEKRKRITPAQSVRFLETLSKLRIKISEEITISQSEFLLSTARSHGLTAYDAAYLDLALRLGVPLATLDEDLKKAARKSGVVLIN